MQKTVVYGAGGMGREVAENIADAARAGAPWELVGFLDDSAERTGSRVLDWPVVGPGEWISDHPDTQVVLGVGHPRVRRLLVQKVTRLGGRCATFIHPSAIVFPSASIGAGAVIFAASIISSGAQIGRFSYVNYQAVVSHDAIVGDYACLMTRVVLAGSVQVGEGSFVGVGACTRQNATIGAWTIIGAGATVINDIPSLCVAMGVPAIPTRFYGSWEDMPPF